MARPLRIEFAGALSHLPARGNAREVIYSGATDRQQFLMVLQNTVHRHDWYGHAYCLMDNHDHLLIETSTPTLPKGMKYLNGTYTQYFNRPHQRVGHALQGRFKAILVQKNAYLLDLARYITLNPVRVQMVPSTGEWRWISYRATADYEKRDACLTTEWILTGFANTKKRRTATQPRFCSSRSRTTFPLATVEEPDLFG